MTFHKCQALLGSIRSRQQNDRPLVRVDYAGKVYQGRVSRSDTDARALKDANSPYGVLVLENPGLVHAPETILQIADIPENGLRSLDN